MAPWDLTFFFFQVTYTYSEKRKKKKIMFYPKRSLVLVDWFTFFFFFGWYCNLLLWVAGAFYIRVPLQIEDVQSLFI